ncbi:Bug family tripartite tricarboxylate transporter substrate binding protein [Bordetella holmesii]|uniref:Tripartite tricarboxylate transporter family receptor n=2 Tax=Bordetella holmesii TaxID=35814 RepID=A0A158M7Y0_9BORD|nr:tripartite tricarboxylate transporter substrate binding protein [Bordetella holmesii]AHV93634.1 tripartite tricarboxylate transporter receptor family protein [Bordetella holmesii ATCC 51541]AIT26355.1 tripartite tricarboxylate transporter receptor family protein [Bordetella holmesii 44057]EWM42001.1 tripartite tricarboxylate transporter receptor family protein [Bordetella holmesii 41130]EWM46930.1 tripartite tricarboxylate transporter receptor family protein [Bordetella holmesii 35009]EWM51
MTLRYTAALAASLTLSVFAAAAQAAGYPERPIEWVVPYPAGGGSDIVARTLSEPMSRELKQTLIISNKPGAATAIGADYAARAKPDGYVMLTGDTATLAANPSLYPKLAYQPQRDFDAVGLMTRFSMILVVNPSVPVKTYDEFLAWAKTQKDGVPYATPGSGSPHHLATESLRARTGLNLVHVPYRGAAPAVQDVVGGQVPMMFVDSATGMQYIASGKLRPIAVASDKRPAGFPQVPTLIESGLDNFEAYAWQGLVVPKGTPPEVVTALNQALQKALAQPSVQERFSAMGLETLPGTPHAMSAYAADEQRKWAKVIKEADIRVD